MKKIIIVSSVSALLLSGCFGNSDPKPADSVKLGKEVFEANCASCHGVAAAGLTQDWKQKLPNGKYPAPPLNGTAHAWHHSPRALLGTINDGGVKLGGWMPGFRDKLNEKEKQALLDYIYSLWPKGIQSTYNARFGE